MDKLECKQQRTAMLQLFRVTFAIILINSYQIESAQPSLYGQYGNNSCTVEQFYVGNYVSGGSQYAYLVYPTEAYKQKTKLPFLTFGHGAMLGGNSTTNGLYANYGILLQSICSYGYIIAAPQSCVHGVCTSFYLDMITTITTCKSKGDELIPALIIADFTKIGVFGHSMGAISTLDIVGYSINAIDLGIMAGGILHGDNNDTVSNLIQVPLIYFTASNDSLVDPVFVKQSYNVDPIQPKVYVEIEGSGHMEPSNQGKNREDAYVAIWFDCILKQNSTACNHYFYDNSSDDNICSGGPPVSSCNVNVTNFRL